MADLDSIPLQLLAEYRMLTPTQFAFLEMRSRQLVRRSMRHLSDEGCIDMHTLPLGSKRGRPEQFVALTSKGWSHLRENGGITKSVVTELAGAGRVFRPC